MPDTDHTRRQDNNRLLGRHLAEVGVDPADVTAARSAADWWADAVSNGASSEPGLDLMAGASLEHFRSRTPRPDGDRVEGFRCLLTIETACALRDTGQADLAIDYYAEGTLGLAATEYGLNSSLFLPTKTTVTVTRDRIDVRRYGAPDEVLRPFDGGFGIDPARRGQVTVPAEQAVVARRHGRFLGPDEIDILSVDDNGVVAYDDLREQADLASAGDAVREWAADAAAKVSGTTPFASDWSSPPPSTPDDTPGL